MDGKDNRLQHRCKLNFKLYIGEDLGLLRRNFAFYIPL